MISPSKVLSSISAAQHVVEAQKLGSNLKNSVVSQYNGHRLSKAPVTTAAPITELHLEVQEEVQPLESLATEALSARLPTTQEACRATHTCIHTHTHTNTHTHTHTHTRTHKHTHTHMHT